MARTSTKSDKPAPPKRPLTAFFLYKEALFPQVKKENPDSKVTELTKIISQKWNKIEAEEKTIYEKKHEEAKLKYEKAVSEYEKEHGPIEKKKRKSKKAPKGKSASKGKKSKKESEDEEGDDDEDEEDDEEDEDEDEAPKKKKGGKK